MRLFMIGKLNKWHLLSLLLIAVVLLFLALISSRDDLAKTESIDATKNVASPLIGASQTTRASQRGTRRLETPQLDPRDWEEFIGSQADKVNATVAAYYATLDRDYWERLKNFPESPLAAITLLLNRDGAYVSLTDEEVLEWSNNLVKSDPDNGVGYLSLSQALARSGDNAGAIAALEAAANADSFDTYPRRSEIELHLAWEAHGYDRLDARLLADKVNTHRAGNLRVIAEDIFSALSGSPDEPDLDILYSLLEVVQQFGKIDGGRPSSNILFSTLGTEANLLYRMPKDYGYGENGMSVTGRVENLVEQLGDISEFSRRAGSARAAASTEQLAEFYIRKDELGEQAASQWLIDKVEVDD